MTEEVTGIDLVRAQLEIAQGRRLADIGLDQKSIPAPRGIAVQLRVNMETINADGSVRPAGGTLTAFEPPIGPGIRVDAFGYSGYATNPRFDSLLAKVIVHAKSGDLADVAGRAYRALSEFRIVGAPTNISLLQAILQHPAFQRGTFDTRFVEGHLDELLKSAKHPAKFFAPQAAASPQAKLAGARVDSRDPLAVLNHGRTSGPPSDAGAVAEPAPLASFDGGGPEGTVALPAPMLGTIVSLDIEEGDAVSIGQQLLIMEAMKMQHVVKATTGGTIRMINITPGDTVYEGHPLIFVEPGEETGEAVAIESEIDLDEIRPDLAEVLDRQAILTDERRPDAVARRRRTNQRTTRENIAQLVDPGTFAEYGGLAVAARRRTVDLNELIHTTQADSLIAGTAQVNGALFPPDKARVAVVAYDYTVLAGTQGKKATRRKTACSSWRNSGACRLCCLPKAAVGAAATPTPLASARCSSIPSIALRGLSGLVPTGRHYVRPLLRRQCRAARLLRRGHCDREFDHRHGRPGNDRRRRAWRLSPRRSRADERAGAEWRGRYRGRRRDRSCRCREKILVIFPGAAAATGLVLTSAS